jgi:hypothetical protein
METDQIIQHRYQIVQVLGQGSTLSSSRKEHPTSNAVKRYRPKSRCFHSTQVFGARKEKDTYLF